MEHADYYRRLGIPYQADQRLIRDAYRKLVRSCHPDIHPTDPEAENRFKSINEAYQVLSDPKKRLLYDQFGRAWQQHEHIMVESAIVWAPASPADFIEATPADGCERRRHMAVPVRVTLEEAFHGTVRSYHTGPDQIDVQIPPGVETGTRLSIPNAGGPGTVDSPPGDLFLDIVVLPHQEFARRGHDLHTLLTVDPWLAETGGSVLVPTLAHLAYLPLPAETVHGDRFRIAGEGMPHLYASDRRGDLYVQIRVGATHEVHR